MDIKSIATTPDLFLRAQQQQQIEQISALAKTLGLKTGDQFIAQVEKVSQATPAERAELLKVIEAKLAQLNKNSAAPAVKALIAQLMEQKTLLQAPQLKLLSMTVSNPLAPQLASAPPVNLLGFGSAPAAVGQILLMQLAANQRLQILEPITSDQLNKVTDLIAKLQNEGRALPASLLTILQQPPASGVSGESGVKAQQALAESLRQLLPVKDRAQELLGTLPKLMQFLQQLPPSTRSEWLSSELQVSLKILTNHLQLKDQLSNPKLLATVLNNNGQQFEQKLTQALGLNSSTLGLSLANTTVGENTNRPAISLDKFATQDLKGALLGVLQHLEKELAGSSTALIPLSDSAKLTIAGTLPQLLAFLMQKQPAELNQKQLRTQLVLLLHQYTLGSLAKIQLQQIHTLSHQLTQNDQPQPTQSWQMEVPVRHGQEVHPLTIHLEQQWVEDPNESNRKDTKRIRQWNVMLGFDLPDVGRFYAQLALLNEQLSIKFWAEQEQTLQRARTQLDDFKNQLEQQGIHLTSLQCMAGLPPMPKMSLNYSLVDVKT